MNYGSFIIKLVEEPKQVFVINNISFVEIRVKFPQRRKKKIGSVFRILVWGDFVDEFIQYYQTNDFLIIEGHIHILVDSNLYKNIERQVIISVRRIYPFCLKII